MLVKLAKFTHHILTEEDITPNEPVQTQLAQVLIV